MVKELRIYAIIVAYNGMKWYDKCLGNLRSSTVPIIPIVIDNASSDNSVDYIKERFPEAVLILSDTNLGFAKANNIGIRYAYDNGADYVFLLNQDAWIEPNTIEHLLSTFSIYKSAGIVSPIHLNGDKSGLDFNFISYMPTDFCSDLFFNRFLPAYQTDFVNAAAWLVSRNCIETVGGFDTSLFVHYGEDSNFCQRCKYHGFNIFVNTQCTICHDREMRKNVEDEYRNQHFRKQNYDLYRKLDLGDINKDYDILGMIHKNVVSKRKALLKLNYQKFILHNHECEFLEKVLFSREENKKIGLLWL